MTVIQSQDRPELDWLVPHAPVGRRGFIAGSLGVGFAAAVAPTGPLLAQVITTDRTGLDEGTIRIPARGADMPAYRAQPQGRIGLATILVVHEIFGVHE